MKLTRLLKIGEALFYYLIATIVLTSLAFVVMRYEFNKLTSVSGYPLASVLVIIIACASGLYCFRFIFRGEVKSWKDWSGPLVGVAFLSAVLWFLVIPVAIRVNIDRRTMQKMNNVRPIS